MSIVGGWIIIIFCVRSNGVLVFFVFFSVVEGQVDGCFEGVRKTYALAARVLLGDEEKERRPLSREGRCVQLVNSIPQLQGSELQTAHVDSQDPVPQAFVSKVCFPTKTPRTRERCP